MRSPPGVLVAALAVASALTAACGTSELPQDVASEYVRSNGPEKCRLLTQELLERQTGRQGAAALRFCEQNVGREQPPADVRIVESEIVGATAQVELIVGADEERIELSKRSGGWRISDFPR